MFPNLFSSLPNGLSARGQNATAADLIRLLSAAILPGFPALRAPTVSVKAQSLAPEATPYAYTVTAIAPAGVSSTASAAVTTTNNATLSPAALNAGGAFNSINWSNVPGAVGYSISRTVGGPSQGVIAVVPAGNMLECEPAGALVTPAFPLLPQFELHDTGLPVLQVP
jgi:hypothetical protein